MPGLQINFDGRRVALVIRCVKIASDTVIINKRLGLSSTFLRDFVKETLYPLPCLLYVPKTW